MTGRAHRPEVRSATPAVEKARDRRRVGYPLVWRRHAERRAAARSRLRATCSSSRTGGVGVGPRGSQLAACTGSAAARPRGRSSKTLRSFAARSAESAPALERGAIDFTRALPPSMTDNGPRLGQGV